jgi:hypothetical protein
VKKIGLERTLSFDDKIFNINEHNTSNSTESLIVKSQEKQEQTNGQNLGAERSLLIIKEKNSFEKDF